MINQNTEFGILHGSENAPFVYILYVEYSDIRKGTWNVILSIIILKQDKKTHKEIQKFFMFEFTFSLRRVDNRLLHINIIVNKRCLEEGHITLDTLKCL